MKLDQATQTQATILITINNHTMRILRNFLVPWPLSSIN